MARDLFFGLRKMKFEIEDGNEGFPSALSEAGINIYGYGDASLLFSSAIALIGCTERYPYGMSMARYFSDRFAVEGYTPVIPAAIGASSAALTSVRESIANPDMPPCRPIVVMGGGADMPYPPSGDIEETLRDIVKSGGAVVSSAPWKTPPDMGNLDERDRLVRALSCAMVVVSSDLPDWPYDSALAMLRSGKPVGAVPGKIGHPGSTGTNDLLKRGAMPLVDAESLNALAQRAGL